MATDESCGHDSASRLPPHSASSLTTPTLSPLRRNQPGNTASARYSVASFLPDGLADAAEEGEEDEHGEGADERRDDPVALLEAVVLRLEWPKWI